MPPKAPESKAAKLAKAAAGGKAKKKKWSKGKTKEKAQNQVLFEQSTYDKLLSEQDDHRVHLMRSLENYVLVSQKGYCYLGCQGFD